MILTSLTSIPLPETNNVKIPETAKEANRLKQNFNYINQSLIRLSYTNQNNLLFSNHFGNIHLRNIHLSDESSGCYCIE